MKIFLDTSILVKLFHVEDGTPAVKEWVHRAEVVSLLDLARLEFLSALQRRRRNRELTDEDCRLIQAGFQERWATFSIQPLNRQTLNEAEILLTDFGVNFGLRTLDALHLAAFVLIAESDWHFAVADNRLCKVINQLGFKALNPLKPQWES